MMLTTPKESVLEKIGKTLLQPNLMPKVTVKASCEVPLVQQRSSSSSTWEEKKEPNNYLKYSE